MKNEQFLIRPALRKDISKIIDFQQKLAFETENERLNLSNLTAGVTAVFDDPSKGCYYVAQTNDVVVACLITTFEWSDWSNTKVMWIASLYVEKIWRGKGIFKQFYTYLKNLVKNSNDYKGIRLYVNKTNQNAESIYKRIGMDSGHYNLYEWMK